MDLQRQPRPQVGEWWGPMRLATDNDTVSLAAPDTSRYMFRSAFTLSPVFLSTFLVDFSTVLFVFARMLFRSPVRKRE